MTPGPVQIDIEAALVDPRAFFAQPQEVVVHPQLSREVKLKVLRQWKLNALNLAVAEGEGMGGGEESMLGRVEAAIRALGGSA
ncbi:hypothetical protein GCM10011611_28750 [Aliidongia dinghuensis]|uniref:Uncharacterized protein n=1 Tax=Aliidongia dinghuensis TaxID=1867774 RepID=A0A8J2YTU1_9PROT|nr:hypothetical protein [Aliidongia dinghuensis]GGF20922.1 hypothetical protein GCM10011611_28750 [Aliidongia dinghuensis]